MSKKTTRIRLACFDGEYEFQIGLAGCIAIEEKAGVGIGAIYGQVLRGRFLTDQGAGFGVPAEGAFSAPVLFEIVRQGLIGGGKGLTDGREVKVGALKANVLIETYLSPDRGGGLMDAWNIAAAVMHALVEGVDVKEEPAPSKPVDGADEVAPAAEGSASGAVEA
jgi:hypothetical protein